MDIDFESQYADELDLLCDEEIYTDTECLKRKPKACRSLMTQGLDETAVLDNEIELKQDTLPAISFDGNINNEAVKRKAECYTNLVNRAIASHPKDETDSHFPMDSEQNDQFNRPIKRPRKEVYSQSYETNYDFTTQSEISNNLRSGAGTILKRIPEGDFFSVTDPDGRRVYVPVSEEGLLNRQIEQACAVSHTVNLLSVPFYVLKDDVLKQRDMAADLPPAESHRDREISATSTDTPDSKENLWVEKYSPWRYIDLLSDETVNRSLLQWIKLWDYVVFNRDLPRKVKEQKTVKEPKKFVKKNEIEVSTELDKYKRPLQKVVLLCGPPGLGKTTLAHIIARHAGYNVIEMNASDDRSVDLFKSTIESATQMKAVLGDDPRPNCLIIDEIDGAPAATINVLLSICKFPEGSKKKSKNSQILLRPIICICNDMYVPALRDLKKDALVLTFPQTLSSRLASRLYEVIQAEQMKVDMNCLLTLCDKSDNDIRSCLNTLQFLRRHHKEINMGMIQHSSVGQKDAHKSLFSTWNDIFTIPKPKRIRLNATASEGQQELTRWQQMNTLTARFNHVLDVVHSAGDYHKVNQGIYENYLGVKAKDPHLTAMVLSTDWLCFTDHINQYIASTQDYGPFKYIPFMAVIFHLLYASTTQTKLQYPHTQFEHSKAMNKSQMLLSGLLMDVCPSVRKFLDTPSVTQDLLPFLLLVIQPTLRPVNTQLYSRREKADLEHLISIMISYNLTYKQQKQVDMQYNYVLEPELHDIVKFDGVKNSDQKSLTYAAKQLIAREVDVEKMRRSELAYGSELGKLNNTESNVPRPILSASQRSTREHVNTDQPNKPVRNFFGQIIKKSEIPKKKEGKSINILSSKVWFHFKEGFSNAVRRNIRVKDFL